VRLSRRSRGPERLQLNKDISTVMRHTRDKSAPFSSLKPVSVLSPPPHLFLHQAGRHPTFPFDTVDDDRTRLY